MGDATDTIFAPASGAGRAGIAVVRISGPGAGPALRALTGKRGRPRHARLAALRAPDSGEALDEAIVLWFPGPASFSGEDMAELHLHGGRAVVDGVLEALGGLPGMRPAEPGEFTRRAFLAGRLDLTAVEGLADLIAAETAAQRRQAMRQMAGQLGNLYEGWRARLARALAHVEAEVDFADEELPSSLAEAQRGEIVALAEEIAGHLADGRRGERLREGLHVVIAGPPNAGKSSLLNALARREAAIVSPEAGTTRDVIEVALDLGGYPVLLSDTAGLRAPCGAVEAEGVRRATARIAEADLVVWLRDATGRSEPIPDNVAECLEVWSKCDLAPAPAGALACSAVTGAGLADLVERIVDSARGALDTGGVPNAGGAPALTRARHRRALGATRTALERAAAVTGPAELMAEELRGAARELGRLTGRVDVEDLLDVIFADFCIGK